MNEEERNHILDAICVFEEEISISACPADAFSSGVLVVSTDMIRKHIRELKAEIEKEG